MAAKVPAINSRHAFPAVSWNPIVRLGTKTLRFQIDTQWHWCDLTSPVLVSYVSGVGMRSVSDVNPDGALGPAVRVRGCLYVLAGRSNRCECSEEWLWWLPCHAQDSCYPLYNLRHPVGLMWCRTGCGVVSEAGEIATLNYDKVMSNPLFMRQQWDRNGLLPFILDGLTRQWCSEGLPWNIYFYRKLFVSKCHVWHYIVLTVY